MAQSLAERLGFDAGDRVAIVHADDIGMCHAANEGAFEALRRGPATCGSIMVPCPWFGEAAATARANPEFDLGVHLTLTSEWTDYRWGPVAGRSAVPSLLDAEGYLPRTLPEVARHARPEDVHTELRAQVRMALDAGVDVTHLDSHMGTCFVPSLLPVYEALGEEFRVPLFVARPDDAQLEANGLAGLGDLFRQAADRVEAKGIPVRDGFDSDSLGFEPGKGLEHNRARLARLPRGVSYLICHPARDGEELSAITPDSAHQRDFERTFYGGRAGREALEAEGVKTVGMRALRELLREA
jgi:predicted glycoside hydrolase/deacetylase ChbG (UPF0249 family)